MPASGQWRAPVDVATGIGRDSAGRPRPHPIGAADLPPYDKAARSGGRWGRRRPAAAPLAKTQTPGLSRSGAPRSRPADGCATAVRSWSPGPTAGIVRASLLGPTGVTELGSHGVITVPGGAPTSRSRDGGVRRGRALGRVPRELAAATAIASRGRTANSQRARPPIISERHRAAGGVSSAWSAATLPLTAPAKIAAPCRRAAALPGPSPAARARRRAGQSPRWPRPRRCGRCSRPDAGSPPARQVHAWTLSASRRWTHSTVSLANAAGSTHPARATRPAARAPRIDQRVAPTPRGRMVRRDPDVGARSAGSGVLPIAVRGPARLGSARPQPRHRRRPTSRSGGRDRLRPTSSRPGRASHHRDRHRESSDDARDGARSGSSRCSLRAAIWMIRSTRPRRQLLRTPRTPCSYGRSRRCSGPAGRRSRPPATRALT